MDRSKGQKHGSETILGNRDRVSYAEKKIQDNNRQVSNPGKFEKYMPTDGKGIKFLNNNSTYSEIKNNMIAHKQAGAEMTPIAYFDQARLSNVVADLSHTKLYDGGFKEKTTPKYEDVSEAHAAIAKNLRAKNFYNDLMNLETLYKNGTGSQLIDKVIKLDRTNNIMANYSNAMNNLMDFDEMYHRVKDMDNILANGGHIISFDLETLSGNNAYGHNVLSHITELSATVHEVDAVKKVMTKKLTVDSVLGFTEKEALEARQLLNKLSGIPKAQWSNEEKVFFDRMNIYSSTDVKANGFELNVTKAKGIEDIKTSLNLALRGVDKLESYGQMQKSWLQRNGMEYTDEAYASARTKYIQDFSELLRSGTYNGQTYGNKMVVGHNIKGFDIGHLETASGMNLQNVKVLDTLQIANQVAAANGRGSVYAPGAHRVKGKGPLTQEQLASAHGLKIGGAAAHIGRNDQEENARFFAQAIGLDLNGQARIAKEVESGIIPISNNSIYGLWRSQLDDIKKQRDKTSSLYTGGNQVYYMDRTMQKSMFNQDGAFSFEFNPATGKFKGFDGTVIDPAMDGDIYNAGYSAFGPRAGALYTHNIYQINPNEDFKKQFMNIPGVNKKDADRLYQKIANSKELYIIESQQYMDIDTLTKKLGSREAAEYFMKNRPKTYTFETNKSKLSNIGVHVGDIETIIKTYNFDEDVLDPATGKVIGQTPTSRQYETTRIIPNKKNIEGLGFKRSVVDTTGVSFKTNNYDPETLIQLLNEKSVDRTINDPAARKIRDLKYSQIMQIRNYQKAIQQNGGDSAAPIATHIARMVSQNKAIDLTANEEIINSLGWLDYKTGRTKVVSETVRNAMAMDSYINQMSPLIDTIETVLDEVYGKLDISSPQALGKIHNDKALKEQLLKKDLAFKQLWNSYIDNYTNNPSTKFNYSETLNSAKDLNRLDFNMFDLFPNKYINSVGGRGSLADDIVSINLDDPNSLINVFYRGKFNKLEDIVSRDMNAGFDALREAYDTLRDDKRFFHNGSRIFDEIDAFKKGNNAAWKYNVSELSDQMMASLRVWTKDRRAEDSAFGLLHGRLNQNVLDAGKLGQFIQSQTKEQIYETVKGLTSTLPSDFRLLTNNKEQAIQDLMHDYFLTFSFDDMDLSGLTSEQQNYMKKQYDVAERVARNKATDLINSITGTNVQLGLTKTKNGSVVSLFEGNEVTHLDNLFKFNHMNGIMTYQVGNNDYALRLGLGREYKAKDNFILSSNLEKITSRNTYVNNVKWATMAGESVSEGIVRNTKNTARYLMNTSARIEGTNGQLFAQSFVFDANEILTALPDLIESKSFGFSQMEAELGIKDEARQYIRKLADKIKKDPYTYRDQAFRHVLPVDLNYFTNNYLTPIIDKLKHDDNMFDSEVRTILKGVGYDNKNTSMHKGLLSGVSNYYMDPLAKLIDNVSRPPVTQLGNSRLYEKDKVREALAEVKNHIKDFGNISLDSVYTGANAERFMYNNTSTGRSMSTGLTMKYMQIDSYSLRDTFLDAKNVKKMEGFLNGTFAKGDLERAKAVVSDRTRRLSTYEQQSNMNARVHDAAFHRTNSQTINARKQLVKDHKNNLGVIEEVDSRFKKLFFEIGENGEIKYNIGSKVKAGDTLGRFGNKDFNQVITANYDGMFRGRFFDSTGNVVSEADINSLLRNSNVNLSNNEDIMDFLNKRFSFKYQVLGLEEKHGTKVFLGASEKTTLDSMKLAVGEIDTDLANQLRKHGLGDVVGKVFSKDYYDDVLSYEIDAAFGTGAGAIKDRLFKERYAFSDAVQAIDAFKNTQVITSLDVEKHNSATAIMHTFLNQLKSKGLLTEENADKIFGAGNYAIRNGQVFINDSIDSVNLNFDKDSLLYKILNDTNGEMRYKLGDKTVGHYGVGHFTQVLDDSAGTYAGVDDVNYLHEQIALKTKEINKAKYNGDEILKNKLMAERSQLNLALNSVSGEKGIKFSDHMGKNLDRMKYNADSMGLVYESYRQLGQEEEFIKIFGHAASLNNGELILNEKYLGRSYTEGITGRLRNQLVKADDDITLGQVLKDPELYGKYKHIVDAVKRTSGKVDDITLGNAELMYSYLRGSEAMAINAASEDRSRALVEKAINAPNYKQFNMLDFSVDNPDWLDLQTGGQGNTVVNATNNPYTNNLVIKTGLGGNEEYLALSRTPEIHAGDSLIVPNHIQRLQHFQETFMTYKVADGEERIKAEENLRAAIKGIKEQQIADITGKNGLARQMTEYRMDQSFMGKGSGIVMAAFDGERKLFGARDVETLNRMNADIFSQAQFMGKTLNEHYAEGRVIDSAFGSRAVFERMGYFNEDFMNETLSNVNGDIRKEIAGMSNEQAMEHLLSKYGDAGIGVRYPEIMQGSDKINMMYLDSTLKGNEVRVLGPTGMSAKLDFDGDSYNIARLKTAANESYLNAIVNAENGAELTDLVHGVQTSIVTRATTDNAYWEEQVQNFMRGKKGLIQNGRDGDLRVQEILKKNFIAGKAYSAEDLSEREFFEESMKYKNVLAGEYKTDEELLAAINSVEGGNIQGYANAKYYNDRREMITAKIYLNAVGEINTTNQKVKSIVQGTLDATADDYEYKSNLMYDFLYQAEEAGISAKSSVDGLTESRTKIWNESVSGLIKGTGDHDKNIATMRSWLHENISDNLTLGLYYQKSDTFQNKVHALGVSSFEELQNDNNLMKKLKGDVIEDIITTIDGLSGVSGIAETYDSLKIATSQAGVGFRRAQDVFFIDRQQSNFRTAFEGMGEIFEEKVVNILDSSKEDYSNNRAFRSSIEETISAAADSVGKVSTEDTLEGIIEGVGDFAKSMKGKKLAKGAVGIAAGIMIAGFVGGRPRPADTQAMEEYQTPMETGGYMLADPGMPMGNGGHQGYVININARTDQGRDNAINALQRAISSGTSSTINVAMNITDNYGNINDRALEDAIVGAF